MHLHSDDFEPFDEIETRPRPRPASFGHRHGLKVLGAILATMFATVIIIQAAC